MAELQTSVRRLMTRCSQEHALARRWQLSHALDALDWSPPGLPRTAILCLRHLANPSPGPLLTGSAPWQPTDAWRAGFSKSLEQNARHAARPAHEVVGANANAVLFADHAELLACLALDWCARSTFLRWWWKVLFPALDVAEAVRKAWTENPQHVPAALCRLDQAGHSTEFLRALPVSTAAKILENVLSSFGLVELRPALMAARDSLPVTGNTYLPTVVKPSARDSFRGTGDSDLLIAVKPAAPWRRWVEVDPVLPLEHRQLLVICVMLERALGALRSTAFAHALCECTEGAGNGIGSLNSPRKFPSSTRKVATRTNLESEHAEAHRAGTHSNSTRLAPRKSAAFSNGASRHTDSSSIPSDLGTSCGIVPGDYNVCAYSERPTSAVTSKPKLHPAPLRGPLAEPLTEVVHTHWGGIFYLVNVALALGFYSDFTMPARPGLTLPLWDFLAMLGERMIGDSFTTDPLPALLAWLSGRGDDEPPGAWFEPPDGEPIALWLARISNQVEARLAAALGVADHEPLCRLVYRHDAQVEADSSHVDVCFSLAAHPVELRIAGLDRDPGWVPAGGRTIAFHYD